VFDPLLSSACLH